jgi:putative ABC transport system permease protein
MSHPFRSDGQPTRTPTWRRYLGFWGTRVDADVDDEIAFHLEMRVRDYMERGLSERDARAAARIRLGDDLGTARDECLTIGHRRQRRITRQQTMDTLIQDLRFAIRTLGRSKGWTAVAILTLALGIGANTAVFSVVNDLLLDPLRYPDADRLVLIMRANQKSGVQLTPYRSLRDAWKRDAHSITDVQGVSAEDVTETGTANPRVLREARIYPSFFQFAGVRPIAGRLLREDEAQPSAAPVAVLSEKLARERFVDAPAAIGKTIKLDTTAYTVVGVVRDGIRLPAFSAAQADLFIPLLPDVPFFSGPVVARLKPGVTKEALETELRAIADNVAKADGSRTNSSFVISVRSPGSIGDTRDSIVLLASSVALLLLIACANVAHLLLARVAAREREISVRAALGAGRGRIIRQLLTESMLLAGGGCALGLIVGSLGLRIIIAMRPANLGELSNAHIDGRVLAATLLVSAITGIGFGLTAALHSVRSSSFTILRSSIGGTASKNRHRIRSLLVITEMSLSVILLVGATLLIRTVINLHRIDPGFDTANLYAVPFSLPPSRYRDSTKKQAFAQELLERAKRLPGYEAVTVADNVPTRGGIIIGNWEGEGEKTSAENGDRGGITMMNNVRPEYFRLMEMKFVSGQPFDEGSIDRREVIISASLAHQLWPGVDAVGKRLRMRNANPKGAPEPWSVVRAVTADASLLSLHDERNTPAIYYPSKTGLGWSGTTLVVRTAPGYSPYSDLRKLSLAIDPNIAPPATLRVSDLLNATVASQRFMMTLLTTFALLAVCLSAIGLYGVIAYMVSQTTREIGVRLALGAQRMDIARLVMFHGAGLAVVGMVLGLAGALWGVGLLKKTLYGIQPIDPASFAFGAVALLSVAMLACLIPTRRALRVDPVIAMRAE